MISLSAAIAILDIVSTHCTGYLPIALSPESIIALVTSNTAFATSETSALVGRGLYVIVSNICVAVITIFPALLHFFIISFWTIGTCSIGISTPISPRATITPSVTSNIESKFSIPSVLSILEIILIFSPPFSSKTLRIAKTSSLLLIKDAAI